MDKKQQHEKSNPWVSQDAIYEKDEKIFKAFLEQAARPKRRKSPPTSSEPPLPFDDQDFE